MPHDASRHNAARLLALALSCAAATATPARAQTDEQAIRALDSAWLAAFTARDTVRLATFYAPQAVGMYPNMAIAKGTPAIVTAYGSLLAMPDVKMVATPTSIIVSKGGDLATLTGTVRLTGSSPNGPVTDNGSYVEILQKVNGKWMIVNEIVTSHAPMAAAAAFDTVGTMGMMGGGALAWSPLEVKGFPAGAKMTVVHGDPSGAGDYIIRLQFPDGYKFPEHWHPKAEHLTVLSGSFMLGPGSNESGWKTYAAGDFLYLPARNSHSGGAKGATVIQLNGMGPFAINLGRP